MGFQIDFTSLGQGLTDIGGAMHSGKVDDYNKKQEELIQIINEVNTATTPEAKQAAMSKLDAFAVSAGSDPQLQQMYQQATNNIDKFQTAYDAVKQNAPGSFNYKTSSGYTYDPAQSNFKFTGLSGAQDRYDEFGNKLYDAEEAGQFTNPQDYLNWLRSVTADKGSWEQAQVSAFQSRLQDPMYAASLPPEAKNWGIDDIIAHTMDRKAVAEAQMDATKFNSPYAVQMRETKDTEEYNQWLKKEKTSINLHYNDFLRRQSVMDSYRKKNEGGGFGKGDGGFGTDMKIARENISKAVSRQGALLKDMQANPTLEPYLSKAGIPEAGYETQAQLMLELSTRAKEVTGKTWQSLTLEEQNTVIDSFTSDLKSTLPKARIAELSADVTKAGNELSKIPQGDWVNTDNMLTEYYTLDEVVKGNRSVVESQSAVTWVRSVDKWQELRKENPNISLVDVLNANNLVVAPSNLAKMNAASQDYIAIVNKMSEMSADGKAGTPAFNKLSAQLEATGQEINSYVLTGGIDVPLQTQQPLNLGKVGSGENPLYMKENVIDPEAARSLEKTKKTGEEFMKGKPKFPTPEVKSEEADPAMFKGLEPDMRNYMSMLTQDELRSIVKGSGAKGKFDDYVESIPSSNPSAKNIRLRQFQDVGYAQFRTLAEEYYNGE